MKDDWLVTCSQHMTSPTLPGEPPPWQRHHEIPLTMRPTLDRSIVPTFFLLSACFSLSVPECSCMPIHSFKPIQSLHLKEVDLLGRKKRIRSFVTIIPTLSFFVLDLDSAFVLFSLVLWFEAVPLLSVASFVLTLEPSVFVCLLVCEYKSELESSKSISSSVSISHLFIQTYKPKPTEPNISHSHSNPTHTTT